MSAGTLSLTNASPAVIGSDTTFTADLAAGDFIVTTVAGVTYTLPVKSVDSDTGVTLVSNYTGPTQSGNAWAAVPRSTQNQITAELVVQSTTALRGLNYDKQNWQQVYSAAGNITVKLPDGTMFAGPSWKYLSDKLSSLGNSATRNVGTATGTVAAGDDARLSTVNGKTGGEITSSVSATGGVIARVKSASEPSNGTVLSGASILSAHTIANVDRAVIGMIARYTWGQPTSSGEINVGLLDAQGQWIAGATYTFNGNGSATAPGQWVNNSDERIKTNKQRIVDPLVKMRQFGGYTWERLDGYAGGIGFIAQEVQKVFPGSVFESGIDRELTDGTTVKNVLSVDTSGVAAALHHEAILALMSRIDELEKKIDILQSGS